MISKSLLRLGWNWNCQCCQHGIFFVNVWYLLDNPAACITSHITGRKMNECHSLEVFSVQTTEVKVLIFWLIPALMLIFGYLWKSALKPDTTSDSKEKTRLSTFSISVPLWLSSLQLRRPNFFLQGTFLLVTFSGLSRSPLPSILVHLTFIFHVHNCLCASFTSEQPGNSDHRS